MRNFRAVLSDKEYKKLLKLKKVMNAKARPFLVRLINLYKVK